jgi:hypothetical protein
MDLAVRIDDSPVGPWTDRAIALLFVVAAVGFVAMLSAVTPDPRGYGTHEMLGLAACSWPEEFGIPCPTCGVTTAAAYLVHLSPWRSFVTQPFGFALAAGGLWLGLLAIVSLVRGRSFIGRIVGMPYGTLAIAGIVLLLASWGYRVLTFSST